jgi:hypothetical protein
MTELHFETSCSISLLQKQQRVIAVFYLHPGTDILKIETNYIPLHDYQRGHVRVVRLSKL